MAVKDIHTHNAFAESVGAARNQYKLNPLPASVNQAKIDKETYKRWFKYIQDMGANTIRIYTVQQDVFYNAFYEYNKDNDNPLYLIHGVWVNDYTQNSHRDALDKGFKERFLSDCRTMLDVIHGNKKIGLGRMASAGSGFYLHDVSQWIIGYILGVEWEDVTVAYTNEQYKDIKGAGCSGCCVFSWQDEWFKRTWNTMYAVNLKRTPYWSDYQTNEQYFGLISFDPGSEQSVCYVDGDASEWTDDDIVADRGDMKLSMKYDEKFVYFMVKKDGLNIDKDKIYIPLDITPKSGSSYYEEKNMLFDRAVDFIIELEGKQNSRVRVQERYEVLRSNYSENVYEYNAYLKDNIPSKDSPRFTNIDMILQTATPLIYNNMQAPAETFETGKLTYGNANPSSKDFNSLADFMAGDGFVEIKLPWQLLNFSDPSLMTIHDDYYEHYGIEYIEVSEIWAGLSSNGSEPRRAELKPFKLKKWENTVTYHERLKSSYYALQKHWRNQDED